MAKEGRALMYADDLVLICETKEEARQRFVAWRNVLESKGLKVNISKTKVTRYAWDGVPKEAAVDPCSVCGKRVSVNSSTAQHVATGYTGDVQECEEVWHKNCTGLCVQCVELEEEKQLMSFISKMSS